MHATGTTAGLLESLKDKVGDAGSELNRGLNSLVQLSFHWQRKKHEPVQTAKIWNPIYLILNH